MVMAQHELSGPASEVLFSTDYGRCWRRVPLEVALTIENIRWGCDSALVWLYICVCVCVRAPVACVGVRVRA